MMDTPDEIFTNITVYRLAAGTRDDEGKWVPGAETSFTIRGSFQPWPGKTLDGQIPGLRTDELGLLITPETNIRIWEQTELTQGDQFAYRGNRYGIIRLENWPFGDIDHAEYLCARVEPTS